MAEHQHFVDADLRAVLYVAALVAAFIGTMTLWPRRDVPVFLVALAVFITLVVLTLDAAARAGW